MTLSLKNQMELILGGFGFKVGSFTLMYGKGKQMPKTIRDRIEKNLGVSVALGPKMGKEIGGMTVMEEIEEVDKAMGKNMAGRPMPFRDMEAKSAKAILDERKEHSFTPEAMVKSGWSPFKGFWFKQGWSRIIFHNFKDVVRPYRCGDDIEFAGCKVCEKLMTPEVWAARELLRDWSTD